MKTLWKAFKKDLKSDNGSIEWEINKWVHHQDKLEMCSSGLHASEKIIDAMSYTNLEELALVEVKGKYLKQNDKQCWEYMRIKKLYKWTKKDSVALSIFAAELVLDNYEGDERPREAIAAAKKVLKNDTKANRSAAESAESAAWSAEYAAWSGRSAAWSARSARSAAWSAATSARSAATSATSAATSAAMSVAMSAARSAATSVAWSVAMSVAFKKIINKCESFIHTQIRELKI